MFGVINFYKAERAFGFIRTSADAEDVFFHASEFDGDQSQLTKGAQVEFDLGLNRGRQVARNIRLIETVPVSGHPKDGDE